MPVIPCDEDKHDWFEYSDSYTGSGTHCWSCRKCGSTSWSDPKKYPLRNRYSIPVDTSDSKRPDFTSVDDALRYLEDMTEEGSYERLALNLIRDELEKK